MMTTLSIFRRDLKQAVLILLLAPFVLLQGIAPGTMAQTGTDGIELVLCQGDQVVDLKSAADPDTDGSPAHQAADLACPWVAATPTIALAANRLDHEFQAGGAVQSAWALAAARIVLWDHTSDPARGPPQAS